ncbi:MAG: hypothetical protein ACI95T_000987, partial [Flavobacteriales bacterium]
KGGYNNYYFPDTTIIHYKGESTKKSSINYVFVFYKAMAIFAKKHFETSKASLFSKLIKIAIFFSAALALIKRFFELFFLPVIDFCTVFFGLHVVKRIFQSDTGLFDLPPLINISFAVFSLLILVALYFSGGYERPIKVQKVVKGVIVGAILNSIVYVFVADKFYFTIPKALLGITIIMFGLTFVRWVLHFFKIKKYKINFFRKKIAIIGEKQESEKVKVLVEHTQLYSSIIGVISPEKTQDEEFLGDINNLKELQKQFKINEAIFCSENVDYDMVIDILVKFRKSDIQFKLAHTQDMFVLGSTDLNTSGELHTIKVKGIESAENRKIKRLLDVVIALKCIAFSPILFWFQKEKKSYFSNVIAVLFGKKSMVGYFGKSKENLPLIKNGILSLKNSFDLDFEKVNTDKLNRVYAKDYSIYTDIKIIRKSLNLIGNKN